MLMDISDARLSPSQEGQRDIENRECFICHKPGCWRDRCPMNKQFKNSCVKIKEEGKENSRSNRILARLGAILVFYKYK